MKAFKSVANIVVALVCPTHTNFDVYIPIMLDAELSLSFRDSKSKWHSELEDTK